ncbi:MAG: hypothetical protein IIC13_00840 [SAR324 cluster bacterium]|nr:hypothetical protein [SAR324 cluster bacterium]
MIVLVKLILSAAVVLLALGYSVRHRHNRRHRQLMFAGVLLATVSPVPVLASHWMDLPPPFEAYWLVQQMGGVEGMALITRFHQGAFALFLVLLWTQSILGFYRSIFHHALAWMVILFGFISYSGTMMIYY